MTHPMVADRTVAGAEGEHALVERARHGDRHAFDRLVASRLTPTFRLARAIVGDTRDAEDATQEAFLNAWRNLPRLRDTAKFDAWFGRIVVNEARLTLRRRGRVMTVPVDVIDVHDDDRPTSSIPGSHDPSIDAIAASDALQRAIDRLTVEQRTILAGIAEAYQPESLVGRTVVIVANLKAAKLMGMESNGMVLAASPEGGKPVLLTVDAEPGWRVR